MITIDRQTLKKFNVPGPRYTSYPTAPEWSGQVDGGLYIQQLKKFGKSPKTLSLYIHIPFCQSLCTFCACSVVIRKKERKYSDEYLKHLFTEIDLVADHIGKKKEIRQFHLGGGTPTFLESDQIALLVNKVVSRFHIDFNSEIAIEIDPRTIDSQKIRKLRELGFNRISMGVQDFDERVQASINRVQPLDIVKKHYDFCRELKFKSINFDLIYGLPYQTLKSFHDTVEKVIALKPDRIALYSFAYLPALKKHQSKIVTDSLPSSDQKIDIFLNSRGQLIHSGYQAIAMDHFALKEDELSQSFNTGTLYRNFMGYTVKPADEYLGLGVSSIGFLENTFFQNEKILPEYYAQLKEKQLPIVRGKALTEDDLIRQWVINSLMCHFKIDKKQFSAKFGHDFDTYFRTELGHVKNCVEDNLILTDNEVIAVTELGKVFIRNICMGFDFYLKQKTAHAGFSQTV